MGAIQELNEAINNSIEKKLVNIRTSIPGEVVKYYPSEQVADIQIMIKRRKKDGEQEDIPILPKVPVRQPRTTNSFIQLPVKAGDKVIVFFHDRDIDNFRKSGKASETNSLRKFSLSDAFCLLGCFEDSEQIMLDAGDDDNIVIQNGDAKLTLSETGNIRIGKAGSEASNPVVLGNEVKAKIDAILDILIAGTFLIAPSVGAPTIPNPATLSQLTTIKAQLGDILSGKHFTDE